MKISKKVFVMILILGLLIPSTVFAWTAYEKSIKVRFAQISLNVNGKVIETSAEPFIYNGNVYAPVATIANALHVNWEWNNDIPAVYFFDHEFQLMEENYTSGNLVVEPLGEDYYYYSDGGFTYISKGLRYQGEDSVIVTLPPVQVEGYDVSEHFYMPITEFIDIDQDGKKQELLVTQILFPIDQDNQGDSKSLTYVIKLMSEGQFEYLDSVLTGSVPINDGYFFDAKSNRLFVNHFQDNAETIALIETYGWQHDHIELIQSFEDIGGSSPYEK